MSNTSTNNYRGMTEAVMRAGFWRQLEAITDADRPAMNIAQVSTMMPSVGLSTAPCCK